LGCVRSIAEFINDCGKEQRDGVQWSEEANGDEHVGPDLPVSECLNDIFEMEVVRKATILGHSSLDFSSLFGRKKLSTESY
jgi:hypothetical protein